MQRCPSCEEENAASARFCSQCATALQVPTGHRERRVVTVLFCDLVDSTLLGERLDPETLQRVLDRYFGAVRDVVEGHGGRVDKFIGDAVVAVFGVPTTHEDDAVRAARAALDLLVSLDEVNAELADLEVVLQVRVGIQSGDVSTRPRESTRQDHRRGHIQHGSAAAVGRRARWDPRRCWYCGPSRRVGGSRTATPDRAQGEAATRTGFPPTGC